MEHTGRQTGWKSGHVQGRKRSGTRLLQGALLVLFAFLAGRTPMPADTFPAAIALAACLTFRNPLYLYLAIPAGAGIFSCIRTGCDAWSELAALVLCALLFPAVRKIRLQPWHCALIAGSIGILTLSVYRLITGTVNQTGTAELLLEGGMITAFFLLFDDFLQTAKEGVRGPLSLAGATAVLLLSLCGAGAGFFLWPVAIFWLLCVLCYGQKGDAAIVIVVSGLLGFFVGEGQWGFMLTLLIAACLAGLLRRFGTVTVMAGFIAVCLLLKLVESGLILGIDHYCLLLAVCGFAAVNWKWSTALQRIVSRFSTAPGEEPVRNPGLIPRILEEQEQEMNRLAELYDTYVDSRSLLAAQFGVTRQMLEHTRWQTERILQKKPRGKGLDMRHEKFRMEIAASQCAAAGSINGDCCGWQDLGDGRTALVISDGMGKGKRAAAESLLVTRTVLGLLKAGAGTELTLKMINTIMMMKEGDDSFATVDLVVADRCSGRAGFYKIGAAPTLIRRKNNIEEVQLSAVPLGIVNGLEIRSVEVTLKKGDFLIMMSDGVSDGAEGKGFLPQLKELLQSIRSEDPAVICDLVLAQVSDSYLGKERDDLTVMAAKLL